MNHKQSISLIINQKPVVVEVRSDLSLVDFLHEHLGLTGTKVSCAMGICKACTVAARPLGQSALSRVQACITPVAALHRNEIITVEGLANRNQLAPLQQSFLNHFSFQCGYCVPGFLMGTTLLLDQLKAQPIQREEIDSAISKNLGDHICRCTGYAKYYEAIKNYILATPGLTL